jgi:hypothetical protein
MSYKQYFGQNYDELKAQCRKSGKIFEDDKFPANNSSLFRKKPFSMNIVWKRPHEIVQNPQLIVDSIVANDLDQGRKIYGKKILNYQIK